MPAWVGRHAAAVEPANPFTFPPGKAVGVTAGIGRITIQTFSHIGDLSILAFQVARALVRDRQRRSVVLTQLYHIGYLSLPVVLIFGMFLGLVMAVQCYVTLVKFRAEVMCGPMINYSLVSQLAPAFTALIFAGRVGSNLAAELGTMQITEQINALRVMGTNPIAHLVAPRVLASVLLLPLLTALASLVGIIAAAVMCIGIWQVDAGGYWFQSMKFVTTWDILCGLAKTFFFGAIIALVSCRQGLATQGGATGVGQSVTRAVVEASLLVMVVNFVLTLVFNKLWALTHVA